MAQHGPDAGKACAVTQHRRRCRVTQHMCTAMDAFNSCSVERATHDALHGNAAQWSDWRDIRQEHSRRRNARPCPLNIGQYSVANLLGQRQPFLAPDLTDKCYSAIPPVNVIEAESADFACPEAQSSQQEHDSAIA